MLLWLLHQKGFFDPLYDWWDDRFGDGNQRNRFYSMHGKHTNQSRIRYHEDNGHRVHHKDRLHPSYVQKKQNSRHTHHLLHKQPEWAVSDHYHLKHDTQLRAHKQRHKHKHNKDVLNSRQSYNLSWNGAPSREMGATRDEGTKYNEEKLVRQKHVHGRVRGEHLHSKKYGEDSWNLM